MREQTTSAEEAIVRVDGLTRRFGSEVALSQVTLTVQRGVVFGLVGENGAGKTTLIKHLLGLYRAQAGSVRVFGLDPVSHPEEVLSRIGYLSEDRDLPAWMRVGELMRYTEAFYPDWDGRYAEELRDAFGLATDARVKRLSRGQLARLGLLLALAYRPDLLLLDEPSSGLDPVVRRDMLEAIIRTITEEGRTVIFSSHLLDEVERVADEVAILHHGEIMLRDRLDVILEEYRRLVIRREGSLTGVPEIEGVVCLRGDGPEWTMLGRGGAEELTHRVELAGASVMEMSQPTLEEIFLACAGMRLERRAATVESSAALQ